VCGKRSSRDKRDLPGGGRYDVAWVIVLWPRRACTTNLPRHQLSPAYLRHTTPRPPVPRDSGVNASYMIAGAFIKYATYCDAHMWCGVACSFLFPFSYYILPSVDVSICTRCRGFSLDGIQKVGKYSATSMIHLNSTSFLMCP